MAKKKSELAYPVSYENTYCLVLKNSGGDAAGSTFGVLWNLVNREIARIDSGEVVNDCDLKPLLIIRDQLEVEMDKGGDE